jgi:hypothetical protein
MLSSLCKYHAEIQHTEEQCPDGTIVKTHWVRLKYKLELVIQKTKGTFNRDGMIRIEGARIVTCTLQKYPA